MRPALLLLVSGIAVAAPSAKSQVEDRLQGLLWQDSSSSADTPKVAHPHPHVVLFDGDPEIDRKDGSSIGSSMFALSRPTPVLVALATDGKSAWVASNLGAPMPAPEKQDIDGHVTALFDAPAPWTPVMTHVGTQRTAFELDKDKGAPPKMPDHVDDAAKDVVKRFKSTIGDPAAFAKTVSARNDVTLFGSDATERFIGGAKVRETLAKWKLAFTIRDGVAAGTSASKTVAWVAAYVDARKADKPTSPATVYLVSAIYEQHGTSWDVVLLHFSNPSAK